MINAIHTQNTMEEIKNRVNISLFTEWYMGNMSIIITIVDAINMFLSLNLWASLPINGKGTVTSSKKIKVNIRLSMYEFVGFILKYEEKLIDMK